MGNDRAHRRKQKQKQNEKKGGRRRTRKEKNKTDLRPFLFNPLTFTPAKIGLN